MSTGKVCEVTGRVAGSVVRKTTRGLEEAKGRAVAICRKVSSICKPATARIEEKRRDAFARLGAEAWNLYQAKVFKSIFQQEKVKKLVGELEQYEKEIQKEKEAIAAQKKTGWHRALLRKASTELKSKDPKVREAAIRALDKLGDKAAIPYLNRVLEDPDAQVRRSAADVLHKLVDISGEEASPGQEEMKQIKRDRRKKPRKK